MKLSLITVCGRKRFLDIQYPYMLAMREYADEHQLWVNTYNHESLDCIDKIFKSDMDYFKIVHITFPRDQYDNSGDPLPAKVGFQIREYFTNCCDEDTVYVRFDDDVCFIEVEALSDFVKFRIEHPEYLLVYPVIINNSMCYRIFPDDHKIRLGNEENDWRPKGGQIALHHHHTFFNSNLSDLKLPRHFEGQLASVNCISWLGSSFAKFEGKVGKTDNEDMAEEPWFIKQAAKNCIYPQMVTCHYAFANQRTPLHTWFGEGLDLDSTTVLQKYQEISKQQLTKQLLFV